eukprot:scpid93932/ scgid21165/ 
MTALTVPTVYTQEHTIYNLMQNKRGPMLVSQSSKLMVSAHSSYIFGVSTHACRCCQLAHTFLSERNRWLNIATHIMRKEKMIRMSLLPCDITRQYPARTCAAAAASSTSFLTAAAAQQLCSEAVTGHHAFMVKSVFSYSRASCKSGLLV